jgi:hypothetical protein
MSTVSIDLRKRSRVLTGLLFASALMLLVGWFAGGLTLDVCHARGGPFCFGFERAVSMVRDLVDGLTGA